MKSIMPASAMLAAASVLTISAASAPPAATPPLTPAQTLDRRAIGDLEFSPDGARLAFTVTEPPSGATRPRHVWLLDVASGGVRQLTHSDKEEYGARWSPDGRTLAFLSTRDGAAGLYLLPMGGGEGQRLVDRKDKIDAFRWSPDGGSIALLMPDPKSDALEKRQKDKDDAHVVDKDDRLGRLWVVDVASRSLRQVTSGRWEIGQFEWLASGDRLVASATATPESDQNTHRLYTIAIGDGRFAEIASPRGSFGGLAVSPDGASLAYVGTRVDGPEPHDLWLQPLAGGGAARNLTGATIDRPLSRPEWVDARTLLATEQRGFASALVTVGLDGRAREVEGLHGNPSAFARSATGAVAYVGETATEAPEIWIESAGAPAKKATDVNAKWASIHLVAPEFAHFKSFDGADIEGALLLPDGAKVDGGRGPRLPFVVLVHGGPTGRWSDSFEPWGQLLAARGYAVLYPNVRGSTGYGEAFVERNRADWGGGDFKDVMAGVDAMVARGVADPNRLGIGGWSYGGYMAAWAVTQTTRFKGAVSGAPVIDMASEFGTERGSSYDEWFYGLPYERQDGFIRSSPITYVKRAKTPTLLLQGEDDVTDPIGQSQQFYRGLKRYGVPSDLVLYPREGHGLREEQHLLDRLNRVVAWFDKYVKGGAQTDEK